MNTIIFLRDIYQEQSSWMKALHRMKQQTVSLLTASARELEATYAGRQTQQKHLLNLQSQLVGLNMALDKLMLDLQNYRYETARYPEDFAMSAGNTCYVSHQKLGKLYQQYSSKFKELSPAAVTETSSLA